jgi:hypothetical protein
MAKSVQVEVGDQLFEREDGRAFGAVMEVHANELRVDIENFGPVALPAAAVRAAHDGKVIVDVSELPADIRERIAHAHDRENQY